MSMMSLRESLARSKAKWKKRFQFSSNDASSAISSTQDTPAVPGSMHPSTAHAPESTDATSANAASMQTENYYPNPVPTTETQPGQKRLAWSGVKSLLATLESSADAFGLL
ncbi:hypothetical protein FRC11_008486, partial [Ceratobasidium sp. 423]